MRRLSRGRVGVRYDGASKRYVNARPDPDAFAYGIRPHKNQPTDFESWRAEEK